MVTFLHHTELQVPWYSDDKWDNVRGEFRNMCGTLTILPVWTSPVSIAIIGKLVAVSYNVLYSYVDYYHRVWSETPQFKQSSSVQSKIFMCNYVKDVTYSSQPRFSQIDNIGNNGNIAICVFPKICSFVLYSYCIVLRNAKFEITGYKRITVQGWICQWSNKFWMAQLKYKWQYCHIVLWRVCENLERVAFSWCEFGALVISSKILNFNSSDTSVFSCRFDIECVRLLFFLNYLSFYLLNYEIPY